MNGHTPHEHLLGNATQNLGASVSGQPVSNEFSVSAGGSKNFRVDVFMGKVVGSPVLKLQDGSGFNLFVDNKTATAAASTQKTISAVDTDADTLTSVSHGYSSSQPVVLNSSGAVPAGTEAGKVYYVNKIDADTFELHRNKDLQSKVDLTDAGSGTITSTLVTRVEIVVQAENGTDVSSGFSPVNAQARLVASTAGGESLQVISIKVVQEN